MKDKDLLAMDLQFFADGDPDPAPAEPEVIPPAEPPAEPPAQLSMDDMRKLLDGKKDEPGAGDPPGEDDPEDTPAPPPQTPEEKRQAQTNYTFGKMRTDLAKSQALLKKLASASGIEYTNEEDLYAKLDDDALNNLAKKQNVPVEMLKRLDELESIKTMFDAEQRKQKAVAGFNSVATQYGLSQDELFAFATELDEKGIAPFEQDVDVLQKYQELHYAEILEKEVLKRVQAALAKDTQAEQHSSTPPKTTGTTNATNKKIGTSAELRSLLDSK